MKRIIFIFIILSSITFLSGREKTEKIGDTQWFTEQNSFEEIIKISQKANKPILGVFSATWCAPCKDVKNKVFKNKNFNKIKEKVILLYIEQTTKEGMVYNKKFNVNSYPTFKIFSKDGGFLDTGFPKRTVKGFLKWIDDVNSGNNYYELSEKLKKDPNSRDVLIKIVDKMGWSQKELKMKYLKKAIKINPDVNDILSQEAYEKLMYQIVINIPFKDGEERIKYLETNKKYIDNTINSYYPNKFKYSLKSKFGLQLILMWYNKNKEYKNSVNIFNDFIKSKKNALNLSEEIGIIQNALEGLLNIGKTDIADKWLKKIAEFSKDRKNIKNPQSFYHYYYNSYPIFIDYFVKIDDIKTAEKYAEIYYDILEKSGNKRLKDMHALRYAKKYGILANKIIEELETKNRKLKGVQLARSTASLSNIYFKAGKKEKAKQILLDLYNNKKYLKSIKQKNLGDVLNTIAWTFIEIKSIDKPALKISREAVKHSSDSNSLDTLATILAGLGNYKEAIKIEKEAIEKSKSDFDIKEFNKNIKKWEKNIK